MIPPGRNRTNGAIQSKINFKVGSALHSRYSIVIEAVLGIPSLYFLFCSPFAILLFLHIYRIHACFATLIAIDNVNTICAYVII